MSSKVKTIMIGIFGYALVGSVILLVALPYDPNLFWWCLPLPAGFVLLVLFGTIMEGIEESKAESRDRKKHKKY